MIEKIVSGGQTGVDQAALLTASELGIEVGGWCPKGGLDADGVCILDKYPQMKQATTENPDERTKLNIRDSDATLIIVPSWPLPENIKDGTNLTIEDAIRQKKPYLIFNMSKQEESIELFHEWLRSNSISTLNIGGPRESNSPGIFHRSCTLFQELFTTMNRPSLNL